jgi:NhaP-type Na+/H+ or K+/H+ antiporter
MVSRIAAQVGLLSFAVAVMVGLHAGNPPVTVLQRAVLAMGVGFLVGQFAGWSARLVLREFVRTRWVAAPIEDVEPADAIGKVEAGPSGGPSEAQ